MFKVLIAILIIVLFIGSNWAFFRWGYLRGVTDLQEEIDAQLEKMKEEEEANENNPKPEEPKEFTGGGHNSQNHGDNEKEMDHQSKD